MASLSENDLDDQHERNMAHKQQRRQKHKPEKWSIVVEKERAHISRYREHSKQNTGEPKRNPAKRKHRTLKLLRRIDGNLIYDPSSL